jgi:hypothetical protein
VLLWWRVSPLGRASQADGLHAVRDGIASCKAYGERHVKQLGTAWAVANGTYRPQQKTARRLYGNYRVGKVAEVWPPDPQPLISIS